MKIVATSISNNFMQKVCSVEFNGNYWMGFPGILCALPPGDDVHYLDDYQDLYKLDSCEADLFLIEIYSRPTPEFIIWAQKCKDKIVVGGSGVVHYNEDYAPYVYKMVYGKCDDIFETIAQPGQLVRGISNFVNLPRYDLYDLKKLFNKYGVPAHRMYGTWTQAGCEWACDFCYLSHDLNRGIGFMEKPLEYLEREVKLMQSLYGTQEMSFLYDPNTCSSPYWKDKLEIMRKNNFSKSYSMFVSYNNLDEETIKYLKSINTAYVFLGIEELDKDYPKNLDMEERAKLLLDYQIATSAAFIINPFTLKEEYEREGNIDRWKMRLIEKLEIIKPVSLDYNFLQLRPGTTKYKEVFKMDPELAVKWSYAGACYSSFQMIMGLETGSKIYREALDFARSYSSSDFYRQDVLPLFSNDHPLLVQMEREKSMIKRFNC